MGRRLKLLLAGGLLLAGVGGGFQQPAQGQSKSSTSVTPADYLRWRTELKNWGRWGPNDQLGASNLITAAKIVNAAKLVKAGLVVSLAHAVPQKADVEVEWIEPGTPITRADLEAWEKKTGVKVGSGDVMLLYIGRWKRRAATGPQTGAVAGYYPDTIPFFKERDIAFVGHDFNIDWAPRPGWGAAEGIPVNPVHQAVLNWMGVGIVENLDLERAIDTARRLKRYEVMLTFAPIPVEGGTGSPLNPLAVF